MNKNKRTLSAVFFLVLGILFIITGIYRNEPDTVQKKSNIICLECIGIG